MNIQQTEKNPATSGFTGRAPTTSRPELSGAVKPVGTFGGSIDFILRIRNGKAVAADTGDQGGGQN
jgi:hypothetical protein